MSEIEKQLREYAADNGYSHLDYSDTMLMAADRIAELERQNKAYLTIAENQANLLATMYPSDYVLELERQLAERGEAVGIMVRTREYGEDWHEHAEWVNGVPKVGTKLYTSPQVPEGWQLVRLQAALTRIYNMPSHAGGNMRQLAADALDFPPVAQRDCHGCINGTDGHASSCPKHHSKPLVRRYIFDGADWVRSNAMLAAAPQSEVKPHE